MRFSNRLAFRRSFRSRGTTVSSNPIAVLIAITLLATSAASQQPAQVPAPPPPGQLASPPQEPLPAVVPGNRPAIGLALEGGDALGLAHVGVIQWFEDHHIPIDRVAGTSMGALVGAVYATGHTPAEMRALATGDAFTNV